MTASQPQEPQEPQEPQLTDLPAMVQPITQAFRALSEMATVVARSLEALVDILEEQTAASEQPSERPSADD